MARNTLIPLCGFGFLAFSAAGAAAAAPDYCALYAREVARVTAEANTAESFQRTQDRAFYQCLNADEDPPFPDQSAYADTIGDGAIIGEGDAVADDEIVEPAPKAPRPAAVKTAKVGKYTGSGLKQGSAEWTAWCRAHYPNSFDPKTGTVLPQSGGGRVLCR